MSRSFFALLLCPAGLIIAQGLQPVTLPAPDTTGGKPLMQALKARQSTREYSPEKLSPQVLSNLLWAGWGINRPENDHRTAPSSSNAQDISVYVVTADGAYVYDAKANVLNPVASGDLRKLTTTSAQPYPATAAVNLVFVSDWAKLHGDDQARNGRAWADAALIAENVYLYCASENLACVLRATISTDDLAKALNLNPNQHIPLAQSIGYMPKAGSAPAAAPQKK